MADEPLTRGRAQAHARGSTPATALIVSPSRLARFFGEVALRAAASAPPSREAVAKLLDVARRYGHWNATPEENAGVGLGVKEAGVADR